MTYGKLSVRHRSRCFPHSYKTSVFACLGFGPPVHQWIAKYFCTVSNNGSRQLDQKTLWLLMCDNAISLPLSPLSSSPASHLTCWAKAFPKIRSCSLEFIIKWDWKLKCSFYVTKDFIDDTGVAALGAEGRWVKQNVTYLRDRSKTETENPTQYCEESRTKAILNSLYTADSLLNVSKLLQSIPLQ